MPVLTVVFLISYGIMTLLIVEQGKAIQSQHNLIQVLQQDSMQFWAIRGQAQIAANEAKAKAAAKSPATQAQVGTPSTQAKHHSQASASKAAKPQTPLPPVPASDLGDQRRVLVTL